jgi:aldose 1-epimerase
MKLKTINQSGLDSIAEEEIFLLKNSNGVEVMITNYGAIIMSLKVPDRNGVFENIVLGFDTVADYRSENYIKENPYLGAIAGRNANVIREGKFLIDGVEYLLDKNFGIHNLHGGMKGFDKVFWNSALYESDENTVLKLNYTSKDGEEGFPGNVEVSVVYMLTDANELLIRYQASADKKTIINLTQHSYFNFKGEGKGDILDHELTIHAHSFVEFDKELVPTGKIKKVKNTPLDFSKPKLIGCHINENCDQLKYGEGYDVTYVINNSDGMNALLAASVYHQPSGRFMEVFTTLPGMHLYTGNSLNEKIKKGYVPRSGFCFESQYFPDAPNNPHFPSTVFDVGETYDHTTIFKFSVK